MSEKSIPRQKIRAAYLSLVSNTSLVILKLFAGALTGSISIIAEALHSMNDLIASGIAAYAVRHSSRPPDSEHRYGHGKIEDISGLLEATLIIFAAIFIIHEAFERLFSPRAIEIIEWGIAVMLISVIVNILVSLSLYRVAKKTDSSALYADAAHLSTDVITSLGVFGGLIAIRVTGVALLDPLIAICVSLVIIWTGGKIIFRCSKGLMDTRIAADDEKKIRDIIETHSDNYLGFHRFRSRKSGSERYIDLHLVVRKSITVKDGHDLVDHIEKEIKEKIPGTHVLIHLEPCDSNCDTCKAQNTCVEGNPPSRQSSREKRNN